MKDFWSQVAEVAFICLIKDINTSKGRWSLRWQLPKKEIAEKLKLSSLMKLIQEEALNLMGEKNIYFLNPKLLFLRALI
jgi:hypothetical protein